MIIHVVLKNCTVVCRPYLSVCGERSSDNRKNLENENLERNLNSHINEEVVKFVSLETGG